jgi:type IV pilus assembly protein PilB
MVNNAAFIELLVSQAIITADFSKHLMGKYRGDAFAVLLHLVRANPHRKETLARLWGDSVGAAYVDTNKTLFQRDVVQLLPEEFARKHHMILLYQFGTAVTAATSVPTDSSVIEAAERIIEKPISVVFALPEDIETAIEIEYQADDNLTRLSSQIIKESTIVEDLSELTREEMQRVSGTQAVVKLVHGLLLLGVREHASDIHIEPGEEGVRVRFRMDGVLQEKSRLEKSLLAPIISRLKILADLDITEKRRPQDGRINLALPNKTIDFRFSSIPTLYGEKTVLRILGQTNEKDIPDLPDLQFSKFNLDLIGRGMETPYGIFFVTGPTGSGKTTTLFSMLKRLNKPGVNISTIEDPIEYRMPGINQVQANPAVGLDFPTALKSFLRQDPDIILVGEVRDAETADIACRAALTGHMVLATMHANDAVQATTRLIDIGVKPHVVAPSLVGVMAQRLVRRICDHCKEKHLAPPKDVRRILIWDGTDIFFYRGKGCPRCNNSGYSGRIAIHEIILINDEVRAQLAQGASAIEILQSARKDGYHTMRYDGIKKVLRGLTTLEEIDRVTTANEPT